MGLFDIFKPQKSESESYMEKRRSATTQSEINQVNSFFNEDAPRETTTFNSDVDGRFLIEDVFVISGRGLVVTGKMESGVFRVGELVKIQKPDGRKLATTIVGIEQFRKVQNSIKTGDNAGVMLQGLSRGDVQSGDLIVR